MKYELKIEQRFQDKYNGTIYEAGKVITFDKARGEELLADERGLVSLVKTVDDEIKEEVIEPAEAVEPAEAPAAKAKKPKK